MRLLLLTGFALLAGATAAAPTIAATRTMDPLAAFQKSCQTQMFMSAPACACMVAKAKADLDDQEIAYLSISGYDGPDAAKAAKAMSSAQIAKVDHFMQTAPEACEKAK